MSKLTIIGDSNIRNAFSGKLKKLDRTGNCSSDFISATSLTAGYKALQDASNATMLVISFLLNGITNGTELCRDDGEIQAKVDTIVGEYCQAILNSADSKPNCQHYVLPPFYRASPKWLVGKIDAITSTIIAKLSTHTSVHIIPTFNTTPSMLHDDVHLNTDSQNSLYNHITQYIWPENMTVDRSSAKRSHSSLESPPKIAGLPSDTPSDILTDVAAAASSATGPTNKIIRLEPPKVLTKEDAKTKKCTLKEQIEELQTDNVKNKHTIEVHTGCMQKMIYQSVNQADISDMLCNINSQNVVIISGIREAPFGLGYSPLPREVANKLVGSTKVHIGAISSVFVQKYPLPKQGALPDLKITFSSGAIGLLFRQQANSLRKDKVGEWSSIFVSNEPTKSTRVRIAILDTIAKALQRLPSNEGKKMFVTRFDPRPQLCIKTANRTEKRMFYIEVVEKYHSLLTEADLNFARKIAGQTYGDRLCPTFAIL